MTPLDQLIYEIRLEEAKRGRGRAFCSPPGEGMTLRYRELMDILRSHVTDGTDIIIAKLTN